MLYIGEFPPPDGGITLLVKCLADELSIRNGLELSIIDIVQPRKRSNGRIKLPKILDNCLAMVIFMFRVLFKIKCCDLISIHLPSNKIWSHGLYALITGRLFGKKIIVRKFAGTDINSFNPVMRKITKLVLRRSDAYLCETKYLVKIAEEDGIRPTFWFPNHRKVSGLDNLPMHENCRKAVFLGLVRKEKGVEDLCRASELVEDIKVDIYGTLFGDISESFFDDFDNVSYKGPLNIDEIIDTLSEYDVLVLPSYREGYPGVIIEAYSVGIPVIVSELRGIREIVDDTSGIFIKPGKVDQIAEAMNILYKNDSYYYELQRGAREKAKFFSASHWADEFVKICESIMD